ncbi:MAG: ABC transporter permease, partial [Nitriliruptor sp.]
AASFSDQVLPAVTDSGILSLASFDDRSAVESALREGELDAAWVLPAGFSDAVISGQPAEVEAIAHGRVAARARRQLDMASYLATARTAEQAGNYHSIVAIVLGMLGGVFVPISANSGFLQLASGASPHGWFLRGIADQTASGRWVDVLPAAGAIVLFGVVAAVPAVWRLRRAATW